MSRGHDRERAVKLLLQGADWWVARAAGSLGDADLVALRAGSRARLIEVKSTSGGPYERFGPAERARLSLAAKLAGADAYLCWWPPRARPVWIAESEWPVPPRERLTGGARPNPASAAVEEAENV